MRHFVCSIGLLMAVMQCVFAAGNSLLVTPSRSHLTPDEVAVVVNDADALSVKVGEYYRVARGIPAKNIVHVTLPTAGKAKLGLADFTRLKWEIETQLNASIQALVLVWKTPYAVDCNSITSALSFGYDPEQCKNTCAAGKLNPYFNTASRKPFTDVGIRLTMLLPTETFAQAKSLIDRGVVSDMGVFRSTAYYLNTSDKARSIRAQYFPPNGASIPGSGLGIMTMQSDKLLGAQDVMIYQTGLPWVEGLETLKFLPGALADHLTSFGGDLNGKHQATALHWLNAGATASYGTVSEPCNHWQKFPHPMVMLKWYSMGNSAIEAYWKSVAWPMQGLFVGEPLAAPFGR
jgi:uncharacterized protein (TIGR03790 family)